MLDVREMLRRLRLGESARAVAKGLGVSRNTVREYAAWFEAERLLPGDAAPPPPPRTDPAYALAHDAHEIAITGESYRTRATRRRTADKKGGNEARGEA